MLKSLRIWLAKQAADPLRRFVPLFLLYLAGIAYFSFGLDTWPNFINWLSETAAILCYWTLVPFTDHVSRIGTIVVYDGFTVEVIGECAGVIEFMIFGAAVFAYPAPWRKRLAGILIATPILFVFNVMRIDGLLFVGRYVPEMFDFAHFYFWQAGTILVIWSLWMIWLRFVIRVELGAPVRA